MNTDIRISVEFWDHPKTKKLEKQLGIEAIKSLQILWCWTAKNRPDGVLKNLDDEDIELVSKWSGEPGLFVKTLVKLRFLDNEINGVNGVKFVHDWRCHNPWAAEAQTRSDKARFSRLAYVCPEMHSTLSAAGQNSISKEEYEEIMANWKKAQPVNNRKQRISNDA